MPTSPRSTKVDPATTLFRPGSISKLFTWTALMQQVEQGKVDLNADVNKYIDFKIPPYEGKPITVLNLMTHTPGFEEAVKDLITLGPKTQVPLRHAAEELGARRASTRPARLRPIPTTAPASPAISSSARPASRSMPISSTISSGRSGMAHSSFRQPLPANLKPLMSEGYVSGKDKPYGFEFVNAAPAGALSATGEDMAQFMIAHLQNGQYNGQRILQPADCAADALARRTRHSGRPTAWRTASIETNINGMHVIAHGGDTVAFHSDLHLFLDKSVGIFVSFNSAGKEGAAQPLRDALFDRFRRPLFPGAAERRSKPIPRTPRRTPRSSPASIRRPAARRPISSPSPTCSARRRSASTRTATRSIGAAKALNGQPRKWIHDRPDGLARRQRP